MFVLFWKELFCKACWLTGYTLSRISSAAQLYRDFNDPMVNSIPSFSADLHLYLAQDSHTSMIADTQVEKLRNKGKKYFKSYYSRSVQKV